MIDRARPRHSQEDQINYVRLSDSHENWRGVPSQRLMSDELIQSDGSSRFLRTSIIDVSPNLATTWLRNCHYDKQRAVNRWNVDKLIRAILTGTFRHGTVEFSVLNGECQLNDCNHRLQAISETSLSQKMLVSWFECLTGREREQYYGRTDKGKRRTLRDMAQDFADEVGLNDVQFSAAAGAVKILFEGFRKQKASADTPLTEDDHVALLEEWGPEIALYFETIRGCKKDLVQPLRCAATLAVGAVTLRYAKDAAIPFWQAVKEANSLDRYTGQGTLVDVLAADLPNPGRRNSYIFSRMVAACWNASREDKRPRFTEPLKWWKLYLEETAEPSKRTNIHILGSPYTPTNCQRSFPPDFDLSKDRGTP